MAHAYSVDLRERILKDIDAGMSTEDAARKYSVSISWTYSLQELRRTTGSIEPKKYTPGQQKKLAPYEKEVRQAVADHPDATLLELVEILPNRSSSASRRFPPSHKDCSLRDLKITWKKRR